MENDSTAPPTSNPIPTPTVLAPAPITLGQSKSSLSQQILEYTMLGFGIITVFSLIVRNGFLLKIGITLFLIVAVISITRSLSKARRPSSSSQFPVTATQNPKKTNPWKILGIVLLTILLLPVIGYMLLIALLMILIALNGGQGT